MDCERIRREELMESYLSHRLDEGASDELQTHILGCSGCSRLLEELQSLRDGLEERAASIRTAVTKPKAFRFWWQMAAVSVAVILMVSLGQRRWHKAAKNGEESGLAHKSPQPAERVAQAQPPTKNTSPDPGPELGSGGAPTQSDQPSKTTLRETITHPLPQPKKPVVVASSEGNGASSTGESVATPKNVQPKVTGSSPSGLPEEQPPVAVAKNKANEDATDPAHIKLTSAQGVELFQIADATAAPFTFSGSKMFAIDPKTGPTSKSQPGGGPLPNTGRVLFRNGMTAYLEGRYSEAIGFLQSALQTDKKTDDINFYLGVSQILAGHPQEAEIPLGKVIALGNSAYLQSAHYYLGKAYAQQMKLSQGESEFREAAVLPGRLTADSKALLARMVTLRAQLEAK
jgi:TolA-binding protein